MSIINRQVDHEGNQTTFTATFDVSTERGILCLAHFRAHLACDPDWWVTAVDLRTDQAIVTCSRRPAEFVPAFVAEA